MTSLASSLGDYLVQVSNEPNCRQLRAPYLEDFLQTGVYVEPRVTQDKRMADVPPSMPPHVNWDEGQLVENPWWQFTHFRGGCTGTEKCYYWEDVWRSVAEQKAPWRAVVTGEPGQGKTLLLRMMGQKLAQDGLVMLHESAANVERIPLPIVIPAKFLAEEGRESGEEYTEALTRVIRLYLKIRRRKAVDDVVKRLHDRGTWLLIDGINEAHWDSFKWVAEAVSEWHCHLVLTSRPSGVPIAQLPFRPSCFRLAPFGVDEIVRFVNLRIHDGATRESTLEVIRTNPTLFELARNPYLLALLCWRPNRVDISETYTRCQVLDLASFEILGRTPGDPTPTDGRRAARRRELLSNVLCDLFLRDNLDSSVSDQTLHAGIRGFDPGSGTDKADEKLNEIIESGFLVPQDSRSEAYVPVHWSLVEFLVADALARRLESGAQLVVRNPDSDQCDCRAVDGWKFLSRKAWDPKLSNIIALLAGRLQNPTKLLDRLLDDFPDDYYCHRLALAGRCLGEVEEPRRRHHYERLAPIVDRVLSAFRELVQSPFTADEVCEYPIANALPPVAIAFPDEAQRWMIRWLDSEGAGTVSGRLGAWLNYVCVGEAGERIQHWLSEEELRIDLDCSRPMYCFDIARLIDPRQLSPEEKKTSKFARETVHPKLVAELNVTTDRHTRFRIYRTARKWGCDLDSSFSGQERRVFKHADGLILKEYRSDRARRLLLKAREAAPDWLDPLRLASVEEAVNFNGDAVAVAVEYLSWLTAAAEYACFWARQGADDVASETLPQLIAVVETEQSLEEAKALATDIVDECGEKERLAAKELASRYLEPHPRELEECDPTGEADNTDGTATVDGTGMKDPRLEMAEAIRGVRIGSDGVSTPAWSSDELETLEIRGEYYGLCEIIAGYKEDGYRFRWDEESGQFEVKTVQELRRLTAESDGQGATEAHSDDEEKGAHEKSDDTQTGKSRRRVTLDYRDKDDHVIMTYDGEGYEARRKNDSARLLAYLRDCQDHQQRDGSVVYGQSDAYEAIISHLYGGSFRKDRGGPPPNRRTLVVRLRKAVSRTNTAIEDKLGTPPDGGRWIENDSDRSRYYLNTSVVWGRTEKWRNLDWPS